MFGILQSIVSGKTRFIEKCKSQVFFVESFIFRIFSSFMKHYITRAQGPVIVIAKKFKLWSSKY